MEDGVFVKHIEASKVGAIILPFFCGHLNLAFVTAVFLLKGYREEQVSQMTVHTNSLEIINNY